MKRKIQKNNINLKLWKLPIIIVHM